MPLVCFASPKGGVGKTTLSANVALTLAERGRPVVAVDCDPQNSLRLHFSLPINHQGGHGAQLDVPVFDLLQDTPGGPTVLPFGGADERALDALDRHLREDGDWLRDRFAPLLGDPELTVVADTAPGPSPMLSRLVELADVVVMVFLADPVSLSLLPNVKSGQFLGLGGNPAPGHAPGHAPGRPRVLYALNQVDTRRPLNRDIVQVVNAFVGDHLAATVHRDNAVAEAVANRCSVRAQAPESQVVTEIDRLTDRVLDAVGLGQPRASARRGHGW